MPANALFINQLVSGDLFRRSILESGIAQFEEIGRTKGRGIDGFESGLLERIVNQCHPRVDFRIKISVTIHTHAAVEMEIGIQLEITFGIGAVALASAVIIGESLSSVRIKYSLVLAKVVAIFRADAQHVPVPDFLAQLNFGAPPFAGL